MQNALDKQLIFHEKHVKTDSFLPHLDSTIQERERERKREKEREREREKEREREREGDTDDLFI